MDPTTPGPEEYAHDAEAAAGAPPQGDGAPGRNGPPRARPVRLVAGDFLVTVNPVDGSEIEPCPPGERPERPAKYPAERRAELAHAARPPLSADPAQRPPRLLERQEERERLVRLLARGRSVRLTGLSGSGRSVLLDAVCDDCADLAPDGVVRLSGHRRTAKELLHDICHAVYDSGPYRPGPDLLRELVGGIGAVVVIDDLEFGGEALDELLDATPECAFVLATTPDAPAPSPEAGLEDVFLGGLGRGGGLQLLRRTAGRPLTAEEEGWAGDLWFESGGLPVRFVRAGTLLRRRDLPLSALADGSRHIALLAAGLSESAAATLRFAVALGGEVPHHSQLPALIGDPKAEAALAELRSAALITPVGARYRLAGGVQAELESGTAPERTDELLHAAVQHYAWWVGHQSVAPGRVLAEADAVLAVLATVILRAPSLPNEETRELALRLARTAAPAFAAGLDWDAWERTLRAGQSLSRLTGEVAHEAYFHHELGVLALCRGNLDRARAELEASIGLRGALADKRGTVAGRRALALVADRAPGALPALPAATPPGGTPPALQPAVVRKPENEKAPASTLAAPVLTPRLPEATDTAQTARLSAVSGPAGADAPGQPGGPATIIARPGGGQPFADPQKPPRRRMRTTRRNLVSAGAGAVLAAVLGTVVTLGATSDADKGSSGSVDPHPAATQDDTDTGSGTVAEEPAAGGHSVEPSDPGADGVPGTADDPTPSTAEKTPADDGAPVSHAPSGTPSRQPTEQPTKSPGKTPSKPPSKPPTHSPSGSPSDSPSQPPTSEPPTEEPSGPPDTSDSASGTAPGPSDAQSSTAPVM